MSAKYANLYPVFLTETLPGDEFRNTSTVMMRFAPMLAPIMHRNDVYMHFFFVPNRLVSDAWEDFITKGQDGDDAPVLPYVTPYGIGNSSGDYGGMDKFAPGSLWDYMGLPTLDDEFFDPSDLSTEQISALPFKAYVKIWNDWYRDPNFNLESELHNELEGDVTAHATDADSDWFSLRRRMWRKDYFTSCLEKPQRGDDVLIPMSGTGPVVFNDLVPMVKGDDTLATAGNQVVAPVTGYWQNAANEAIHPANGSANATITNAQYTINDLRTSLATQSWLEANARAGGRYIENIEMHFDVRVPDYRLQRTEYLGGGRQPVRISEVLDTAGVNTAVVGDMAGHGISVGKTNYFRYFCQEHGFIMGILSVRPETAYMQGIDRMWTRRDTFDYAFPQFAHLGEQAVLSKELYYSFNSADDDDNNETFGYIPRYAEYKQKLDRVSGDFRTNLLFWHQARVFTERPALNGDFTTVQGKDSTDEPLDRIFAVQNDTDYLWMQIFHKTTVQRKLPYYGVPHLMG